MDTLFIQNIQIWTNIGIYKWEKYIKQKLIIDIEISINNKIIASYDSISNCINYVDVINIVRNYIKNKKFNLLETVAEKIAFLLINNFNVEIVKIKIIKSSLILKKYNIGVSILRKKIK